MKDLGIAVYSESEVPSHYHKRAHSYCSKRHPVPTNHFTTRYGSVQDVLSQNNDLEQAVSDTAAAKHDLSESVRAISPSGSRLQQALNVKSYEI
jgi:hypothetical protein